MKNERIAFFHTARMGSSRLKGKMTRKICGKSVVELGLERLLIYKKIKPIFCTTFFACDNVLADTAERMGVSVYRGHPEDILERYLGAARQYGIDFFVAADGDDLFIEHIYTDKIINEYRKTKLDYIFCEGLPYGTYGFGVRTEALEKICKIKDDKNTEGWGRYFTKTGLLKGKVIQALPHHNHPEYRLTLDYPEDFKLIKNIYNRFYEPGKLFSLDKIMDFLQKNPDIAKINWSRKKEYSQRFKTKYSKIHLK